MIIGSIKETHDTRVALTPESIGKLRTLGYDVWLETDYGKHLFSKQDYVDQGAIFHPKATILTSDILTQVHVPKPDIDSLPKQSTLIAFTNPFQNNDILQTLHKQNIQTLSMEFVPRSTQAQKMDALSSQASLAGYVAVILASQELKQVMPMMMTPAGTLAPTHVFVIGAGVAGLQAIATAKRLGAVVEAFDTRPIAEDQVKSLGAKFIKLDLGKTDATQDGYAKALTPDQLKQQQSLMLDACKRADVIITTAQVFGKPAPKIITNSMLDQCKANCVLVDLAASTGGNIEATKPNETIHYKQRTIIGKTHLAQHVAKHASDMYTSNIYNLIEHLTQKDPFLFNLNTKDDIVKAMLYTPKKESH